MAYTKTWPLTTLIPGSRDADEIDDAVQEILAGLAERLAELVVDVTADPWVAKASQGPKSDGSTDLVFMAPDGLIDDANLVRTSGTSGVYANAVGATGKWWLTLSVSQGQIINSVRFHSLNSGSGSIAFELFKTDLAGSTTSVLSGLTTLGGGAGFRDESVAIGETISGDEAYSLEITITADAANANLNKLFWVKANLSVA